MAKFLLCFLMFVFGTKQCTSRYAAYDVDSFETDTYNDYFGNNAPADHETELYRDELSILDELNAHTDRKVATMTTLDKFMGGQRRKEIESWINGEQFAMAEMSDESGPKCTACFGKDLVSCAENAKVTQCDSSKSCYTVHLTYKGDGKTTVIKGCVASARCNSDFCQKLHNSSNGQYSYCKSDCCKEDLCNKNHTIAPVEPTSPAPPSGPKCYSCQGLDEASCAARRTVRQCDNNFKCASVYVVSKSNGNGILAKGCLRDEVCKVGLCKRLNETGKYNSCNGSCCHGNLCNGMAATLPPTPTPTPTKPVTTTPATTATPVITEPPTLKCFACFGKNQSECDLKAVVRECKAGEICYSGAATLKVDGRTTFARGCTGSNPEQCKLYCKRIESKVNNCFFDCCESNLCNKHSAPTTHAPVTVHTFTQPIVTGTQGPSTGSSRLWCNHCKSLVSEQDCDSRHTVQQCDSNRVCYIGRASYQAGNKLFVKGCMQPEDCKVACNRLGEGVKDCNVDCCRQNFCNSIPHPTQVKPTIKNPNLRALLKLIEAFKGVLDAIENAIRVSAMDHKASNYKRQITSLMGQMETHVQRIPVKRSPAVNEAKKQMSQLRKRAGEVISKIENNRKRRSIV